MPAKSAPDSHGPYLDPQQQADLVRRLSRAQGRLRSVNHMLTNHAASTQILIQLAAVEAAIRQVTLKLLDAYAEHCVNACVEAEMRQDHPAVADLKRMIAMVLK